MEKNKLFGLLQDYVYGFESPAGKKLAECIEEAGIDTQELWEKTNEFLKGFAERYGEDKFGNDGGVGMIPETQRDEMIDMANQITELLKTLKPFVKAGHCVEWEHTKDYLRFYPVNSLKAEGFIEMGDLRQAMEVYEKFKGGG
ncbi:MAG: hypothetical protein KAV87_55685 [Desulfobacteraceae bacterium]|nr:hypothetical protein [Desulfobacteraceae bacterium]